MAGDLQTNLSEALIKCDIGPPQLIAHYHGKTKKGQQLTVARGVT